MKNKLLLKDKSGYEITGAKSQDVKFIRPGENIEVLGTLEDVFDNGTVLIMDKDTDTYTLHASEISIVMNVHCNDCEEDSNRADLKSVMVQGVGKQLEEMPACPFCKSENVNIRLL